jgi:uncharacterized membrane protein
VSSGRRALGNPVEKAGVFVAAANAPLTFQRTLMPRSTLDQGIVTGLSTSAHYGFAALIQDSIEAVALRMAGAFSPDRVDPRRWRRATMAADLVAMTAGFATEVALGPRPREPLARSAVRTAGHWVGVAAFSGLVVGLAEELLEGRGARDHAGNPVVAFAAGAALATGLAYRRGHLERAEAASFPDRPHIAVRKALGIGAAVSGFVAAVATLERGIASRLSRTLGSLLPGDARFWRPAGHAWALSALSVPAYGLMRRTYRKIELAAGRIEPAYDSPPTTPSVSGGPGSLVPWETLGKHGRRNVYTYLRPEWIEAVMQEPAVAQPVRVYVGLASAPDVRGRVDLAMRELDRTGAFDRQLLMVVSPTGTGYVSYVAVEAAEYMTRGNMASVAVQYSLRPSVLSLDRVAVGRRHHRLLLGAIHDRLRERPAARRPRLVLFGESLGAWISQGVFEGQGTKGLLDLGVDRAIWAGVPHGSRWKEEVLGGGGPHVDGSLVGVVNDHGGLRAMDAEARSRLRYVMVVHHEDPVARFGLSLLVRAPEWLGPPQTRPPGVPRAQVWQSPTTFVQTLVDMKNSVRVVPGRLDARGHDYRADLAGFVRDVYALDASDQQLARIEDALRRYETARATWILGHAGTGRT